MTSFQIPPPPPMQSKGNTELNWQNFEETWTDYCIATELDKKDAKIQVAPLKTVMGHARLPHCPVWAQAFSR